MASLSKRLALGWSKGGGTMGIAKRVYPKCDFCGDKLTTRNEISMFVCRHCQIDRNQTEQPASEIGYGQRLAEGFGMINQCEEG